MAVLVMCAMLVCVSLPASAAGGCWNGSDMNVTSQKNVYRANAYGIQLILKRLGYSIGSSGIDGYYGTNTKNAVIKYQQDERIDDDGVVGTNTWNKLDDELTMTCMRNILRNSDNADIGIYDTFKVINSSTTTDCFFRNIGNQSLSRYNGCTIADKGYSGHGTSGSFTLSSTAALMNTVYTVNEYGTLTLS